MCCCMGIGKLISRIPLTVTHTVSKWLTTMLASESHDQINLCIHTSTRYVWCWTKNSSQTMATWQQQNTNGNTSNNNNNNNHNNNNNKKKKKKHTPKTINAKMKINTWPLSVHHQQLKAWPQQPPEWMAGIFDIQIIWVFPKIGIPQNGWFIMENPIKMDDLGGTTILGKIHMIIYVIRSSRVDVDIQKHFTHTYPSVLYCMTIICACSITIKDYTYHLRFTHICDSTLLESMHFEENSWGCIIMYCIRSFELLTWCFVVFQGGQCGHDDFIPLTKVDTLGRKANTISTNPSLQMSNKKLPFCLAGFSLKQKIRPWSQVKKTWWRPKVVFYCSNGLKWKGNEELPNRLKPSYVQ